MKINKFNVVKLKDSNKAIILSVDNKKQYLAEIVNKQGKTIDKRIITKDEIEKVIYNKEERWKLGACSS